MKPQTKNLLKDADPRILWAKDRTFLAWIRTGLALMGFGFVVARFNLFLRVIQARADSPPPSPSGWSMWFGTILVLLGVLVQVMAAVDYIQFISGMKRGGNPGLKASTLGVGIAFGLGIIGIVMAGYLIVNH